MRSNWRRCELPVPVLKIPFYELHRRAAGLAPGSYMLYCGKGVMSRLHASHLAIGAERSATLKYTHHKLPVPAAQGYGV